MWWAPGSFKPMISLTFDDALDEHLDHAMPALEEHGLVGTFYAHLAAPAFGRRLDEWREAARRGHELGNHTIFHPADARKPWVQPGNAIDRYSLDRMRQELEAANRILAGIDGRADRTFAYPCSNPVLGRRGLAKSLLFRLGFECTRLPGLVDRFGLDVGSTRQSYAPLVRRLFTAARAGGLTRQCHAPPAQRLDRFSLPSVAVEGWTLPELIEYTGRGLAGGAWVILQFHGVGGGHRMDCGLDVFRQFAAWLREHHAGRVATVLDGARRLWPPEPPSTASSDAPAALTDATVPEGLHA